MPDKAFENAMARREILAKAINDAVQSLEGMRSELKTVDAFIEQWRKFAGEVSVEIVRPDILFVPSPRKNKRNSKKEEIADAAIEEINKLGEPIPRVNLLTLLINRGLIIEGGDPEVVLSTMLWRMRHKVARLKKGGYWDASRPSPDGSYVPGPDPNEEPTNLPDPYDELVEQRMDEESEQRAQGRTIKKKGSFFD